MQSHYATQPQADTSSDSSTSTAPHDHDRRDDSPSPSAPPAADAPQSAMDTLEAMEQLAASYQGAYVKFVDTMGVLIDQADTLQAHRCDTLSSLQEDVRHFAEKRREARELADDNSALRQARKDLEDLENEQSTLVRQIVAHKTEADHLAARIADMEKELRHVKAAVKNTEAEHNRQYPTARYIHKVLQSVSGFKIIPGADDDVIEGVLLKGRSEEIIPFRYDDTQSHFDAVNSLWTSIMS